MDGFRKNNVNYWVFREISGKIATYPLPIPVVWSCLKILFAPTIKNAVLSFWLSEGTYFF